MKFIVLILGSTTFVAGGSAITSQQDVRNNVIENQYNIQQNADPQHREVRTGDASKIDAENCCEDECGTLLTPEVIKRTNQMLDDGTWNRARMHPLNSRGTQYVRMTSHIVRYSDGSGGISEERVATAIEKLNEHVASTGLIFLQDGGTIYLDSDEYADCTSTESYALRAIDSVDGSVNVWFVPNFINLCGKSSFPGSATQGIVMDNDCTANPSVPNYSTFTHEVGHYFNLYHTHTTTFGLSVLMEATATLPEISSATLPQTRIFLVRLLVLVFM